jgi:hypothetical protein
MISLNRKLKYSWIPIPIIIIKIAVISFIGSDIKYQNFFFIIKNIN